MNVGIYQITNTVTGYIYIGQSTDINKRFRVHRNKLEKGIHSNPFLRKTYKKHGGDKFLFSVILYCEVFELTRYEQGLIDALQPEYNTDRKCITLPKGRKCSEESKKKMSDAHLGKRPSNFGKHLSQETRDKIAASLNGNTNKRDGTQRLQRLQHLQQEASHA